VKIPFIFEKIAGRLTKTISCAHSITIVFALDSQIVETLKSARSKATRPRCPVQGTHPCPSPVPVQACPTSTWLASLLVRYEGNVIKLHTALYRMPAVISYVLTRCPWSPFFVHFAAFVLVITVKYPSSAALIVIRLDMEMNKYLRTGTCCPRKTTS